MFCILWGGAEEDRKWRFHGLTQLLSDVVDSWWMLTEYRLQAMSLGSCLALCTVTCESAYPYFQNVAVPLYVTQSHTQTFKYQDWQLPSLNQHFIYFKPDSPLQRQSTILKTYYLIVRLLVKTLRYCQEKCLCLLEKKNHSSGLILLSFLSPYYFCGWKAFCFLFLQFVMLYSVIS